MMPVKIYSAKSLDRLCKTKSEFAILDIRLQGIYFHEHLLLASCLPESHIELEIKRLVPRPSTKIILCDANGNIPHLERIATVLHQCGYLDVGFLERGISGWKESGFELFSGINVPSKAFGEYVEINEDTPRISATELKNLKDANTDLVILDSRPYDEYHRISIPGGINCPGAELVYRAFDFVKNPETLIVVNCAGRTRSIIGSQSLINAGINNKVVALKDGTMGWQLAGQQPSTNATDVAPSPQTDGRNKSIAAAKKVAQKFNISIINRDELDRFISEQDERSLYILDVRTHEEYEASHLPGARHAPGGQLVQATDEYVATRNSRIVLFDDQTVRAMMTASWLKQMLWSDVYVLSPNSVELTASGPEDVSSFNCPDCELIDPRTLMTDISDGKQQLIIDFSSSLEYSRGHLPGALWAERTRLAALESKLFENDTIVLTSTDSRMARYAARDILALGFAGHITVLEGGNAAWRRYGGQIETNNDQLTSEPNDVWYKPYEQKSSHKEAMQGYLDWEVNLVKQLQRDGTLDFANWNKVSTI